MSEMNTTRILKTLNASGLEINPEVFQKLLTSDGTPGDQFGNSVAVSEDGLVIVAGAAWNNDTGPNSGSAYVFTKQTDGSYLQTQKLVSTVGAVQVYFGCSVAISADGLTIVVGAFSDGDKGSGSGAAYIFTKQSNGSYLQTQKLLATDGVLEDSFGWSVAIAGDSSTVIVGASGNDEIPNGINCGSAYIFTKQANGSYLETQKLLASDGEAYDQFGISVDISGDGRVIVIGASWENDNGNYSGSAYIFAKQSNGSYLETQKLLATDGEAEDSFGISVAVSADGLTIVAGASWDNVNGNYSGSAYIFTKQIDGSYLQVQKLIAADGEAEDYFGGSVVVSADGLVIVVGASWDNEIPNGANCGSVYIFTKQSDGFYRQTQKLVASDGTSGDQFGISVATANTSVVIGAYYHLDKGAVYVY